jgi:hypothetical protein
MNLMENEERISMQRRFGLRLLQLLIIIMAVMLVRNCIIISMESDNQELSVQQQFYNKGYEAGKQKALSGRQQTEPFFPDLLLERKYRNGHRDG